MFLYYVVMDRIPSLDTVAPSHAAQEVPAPPLPHGIRSASQLPVIHYVHHRDDHRWTVEIRTHDGQLAWSSRPLKDRYEAERFVLLLRRWMAHPHLPASSKNELPDLPVADEVRSFTHHKR